MNSEEIKRIELRGIDVLIDTSAWVEFFKGSKRGEIVWHRLKANNCSTSIITLSEMTKWCLKNRIDYLDSINRINKMTDLLQLNEEIAVFAGKTLMQHEDRLGIADSLIYATALFYKIKLLTCDKDFKSLDNVEVLD